ncbi:MAG: Gfo/Idh/MocA family oxidoreductase [Armatimonadota bacterium]|nr:Gfo/Idh/MocA family oxidoreductase [Armatimonadota bacterium]
MARTKKQDEYGLSKPTPTRKMAVPDLPYKPKDPQHYHPPIGLIGCGGITEQHLRAYRGAGYNVVALCDKVEERAQKRKADFYPDAEVYTDFGALLRRPDIEVVDIATHPAERGPIIHAALEAGKHVLSQKPFVTNLGFGLELADLADRKGLKLAVNQNGRWSPHFSYIRQAINGGLVGDVLGAHLGVCWDHNWIINTEFNKVHHVVLYDFAIHWFDIVTQFFGERQPQRVFASLAQSSNQTAAPPLLGQALIEYEGGQASLTFDAATPFGHQDFTYVAGSAGTIKSVGPNLGEQQVTLYTENGYCSPALEGSWFPAGFHGTMAELLCSIEEDRQPSNNARANLASLALCFAAVASAEDDQPKVPGEVREMR